MKIAPQWTGRGHSLKHDTADRLDVHTMSGFNPRRIADLVCWYRAGSIKLADGASVSSWEDESGNGHDLSQGTGSRQPTLQRNVVNGRPVVRFDGSDRISATGVVPVSGQGFWTAFAVADDTGSNNPGIVLSTDDNPRMAQHLRYTDGTPAIESVVFDRSVDADTDSEPVSGADTPFMIMEAYCGDLSGTAQVEIFENGNSDGATSVTGTLESGKGPLTVGNRQKDSQSGNFTGDIAEVVLYRRQLTDDERSRVRAYLNAKYQIF